MTSDETDDRRNPAPPKPAQDNRANQKNPNNDRYWTSRGKEGRPQPTPERAK